MLFFALFLCGFSSAIANRTLDPLTVTIATDLSVPASQVALLASALAFMYAAGQPFIGPLGDQYGKGRVLKIAMWVTGASVLASALAPNFATLMVLRPVTGLAAGGIIPVGMAIIGDLYGPQDRQVALARFIMSAIIGQMGGALLAGVLADLAGWRGVLFVCAGIIFAASIVASWSLPSISRHGASGFSFAAARANYARIFSMPRAWVCFSSPFLIGGLTFGLLPFISPILVSQDNGGAREAGFIIAGFGAGAFLLAFVLPVLLRLVRRPSLMISGALTAGASLAVYALGMHWSVQIIILTIFGFGFFMQHNSIQAEVSELIPEARATAYAMHSSALFIGHAIGPAIYGIEIARLGAHGALTMNGVLIGIAGCLIGLYFTSYHRSRNTRG